MNMPLLAIAREHQATPARICLAQALHRGPHTLLIPGRIRPGYLAGNIAAGALRLTPGDLARGVRASRTRWLSGEMDAAGQLVS